MTFDFTQIADYAALDYRESRDQVDQMERNPKMTAETILQRRSRLELKAQAVHIVRIVADDAAIADLVAQQLEARRNALR